MIIQGDCIEVMDRLIAEGTRVQTCVTSPPYWGLRNYAVDGQIGLEKTPEEYVDKMVEVFRRVYKLLSDDGTLWINLGDSYISGASGSAGDKSTMLGGKGTQREATKRPSKLIDGGLRPKNLVGVPWLVAFALQADGWYLRQDIIWHKPNPMPESVTDRCTKAHEYIFLLSKSPTYYYDQEAILEPVSKNTHARLSQDLQNQIGSERANGGAKTNGNMKAVRRKISRPSGWAESDDGSKIGRYPRPKNNESFDAAMAIMPDLRNKRSVWTVATESFKEAHFATYPQKLIEPCILAGSRPGDIVLDPFNGSGTTGRVAFKHGRKYIGIELNPEYIEIATRRMANVQIDMLTSMPVNE